MDRLRCATVRTITQFHTHAQHAGDPSDPVHIKSIEISPDPPKPGEDMTVKVVGQADEVVEVRVILISETSNF